MLIQDVQNKIDINVETKLNFIPTSLKEHAGLEGQLVDAELLEAAGVTGRDENMQDQDQASCRVERKMYQGLDAFK